MKFNIAPFVELRGCDILKRIPGTLRTGLNLEHRDFGHLPDYFQAWLGWEARFFFPLCTYLRLAPW
jgi:hypothetical protein